MKSCNEMVISLLERRYQYEHEKKQKRKKLGRYLTTVSCMCIALLLVFGAWQAVLYFERLNNDINNNNYEWGDGSKVTKLWAMEKAVDGNSTFKRLTPANLNVSLSITPLKDGSSEEDDVCAVLFGQYLTTIYGFDYEGHFAVFPEPLVQKEFVSAVEKHGLSYYTALEEIDAAASKLRMYDSFEISYNVDKVIVSNSLMSSFGGWFEGYEGWFEEAGVPISEISEVKIYFFNDIEITFGGLYTQKGDPGISLDSGFKFYKYNGSWYYWPSLIENDMSVDLALSRKGDASYFRLEQDFGFIESIEDGYISLGDDKRYYAPELAGEFKVGDEVGISYFYYFGLEIKNEDERLKLYRASKIKSIADYK